MMQSTITKSSVRSWLKSFADCIAAYDVSMSVVQFGSSINNVESEQLDLDILILTDTDYYNGNFVDNLENLRSGLLAGKIHKGFAPERLEIERIALEFVAVNRFENADVSLQFAFGPITYQYNLRGRKIYLHCKGPITKEQFILFCQRFPFHGSSIISDSTVIHGQFDKKSFMDHIEVTVDELEAFNDGLRIRVLNSSTPHDIKKCIRKLLLNLKVYNAASTILPIHIPAQFDGKKLMGEENLLLLKEQFFNLYDSVTNKSIPAR